MGKIWLFLIFLIITQLSSAQVKPPPAPMPQPAQAPVTARPMGFPVRGNAGSDSISPGFFMQARMRGIVKEFLYRNPTKSELRAISPAEGFLQKYAEFLSKKNTGLIRLIPDKGCANDSRVVVASEACTKYTLPGAGSSYSFREATYRIQRLADIIFKDGKLINLGKMQQGIFLDLGPTDIEKISLQSDGVSFIADYQPSLDAREAQAEHRRFASGIKSGQRFYSSEVRAIEGNTYVLRSIAYRGRVLRSYSGYIYNELSFDDRRDILVALRIIKKEEDGSLVILWKELQSKKSPKIEGRRGEKAEEEKGPPGPARDAK